MCKIEFHEYEIMFHVQHHVSCATSCFMCKIVFNVSDQVLGARSSFIYKTCFMCKMVLHVQDCISCIRLCFKWEVEFSECKIIFQVQDRVSCARSCFVCKIMFYV